MLGLLFSKLINAKLSNPLKHSGNDSNLGLLGNANKCKDLQLQTSLGIVLTKLSNNNACKLTNLPIVLGTSKEIFSFPEFSISKC